MREDLLLRPRPACAEFLALAGAPLRPPTETEAAARPVLPCGGTAATSADGAVNAPRLPGTAGLSWRVLHRLRLQNAAQLEA